MRLLDARTIDQMEALGTIGVNLIFGAMRHRGHLKKFVDSLMENLPPGRAEIDLLKFSGHGYGFFDNRLCALQLVESGLTDATMFLPNGEVVQPSEVLYRFPVLLLRGSFDPVMKVHLTMLNQAREGFSNLLPEEDRGREIELCEISMDNLLRGKGIDPVDFLDRADALQSLGKAVLLSRFAEFHRGDGLSQPLHEQAGRHRVEHRPAERTFQTEVVGKAGGRVVGIVWPVVQRRRHPPCVSLEKPPHGRIGDRGNFRPPEESHHLYQHFLQNDRIVPIPCEDDELLAYTGRSVCRMILEGDARWHELVPEVAWTMAERHAHLRLT